MRPSDRRPRGVPRLLAVALLVLPAGSALGETAPPPGGAPAAAAPGPAATERSSHDLGLLLGSQLRHGGVGSGDLSVEALTRGLREALDGAPVSAEQKDAAAQFLHAARDAYAGRNRLAAHEFLARNGHEAGVTTTASGLEYRILAAGDPGGRPPGPTDQVTVRYRGTLLDGTEFDSSSAHEQAATFRMNGVIKGWREALLLMRTGAKWQLFVPPELAYDLVSPAAIPPGSLLVYELELVHVEPAAAVDSRILKHPKPPAAAPAPAR